jgi:hypothetical protein
MSSKAEGTFLVQKDGVQREVIGNLFLGVSLGSRHWSLLHAHVEEVEQGESGQEEPLGVVAFVEDQAQVDVDGLRKNRLP